MFSEEVILAALTEHSAWVVSDHLLRGDHREPADLAREIADRNELRVERVDCGNQRGFRFSRWE